MNIHHIMVEAYQKKFITAETIAKINELALHMPEEQLLHEITQRGWIVPSQLVTITSPEAPHLPSMRPVSLPYPRAIQAEEVDDILGKMFGLQAASALPAVNKKFGKYLLVRELGRGGMGIVYEAYEPNLQRKVALKIVQSLADEELKRFRQEAQALAKVRHPHIVHLLEIGQEPLPYLVMEYIEGETLAAMIQKNRLVTKWIAEILRKVAMAVHSAHICGIVHRDIKPANIMMTSHEEPKIMDFGIAKRLDTRCTKSGYLVGTPAYMSPEQAKGHATDARSDIYSLGATLYEMLTGKPPFVGTLERMLYQLFYQNPTLPSRLRQDIPKELEAICMKCLEKKPSKRYLTAAQLAEDLGNFLNYRTTVAPLSIGFAELESFVLRYRKTTFAAVAILSLILLGVPLSFIGWQRAREEYQKAHQISKQKTEEASTKSVQLAKISLQKAEEAYDEEKWAQCGVLAGNALEFIKDLPTLDRQIESLKEQAKDFVRLAFLRYRPPRQNQEINLATGSPNKILAVVDSNIVKLWDVVFEKTWQESLMKASDKATAIALSQNGKILACVFPDHTLKLWDVATGKLHKQSLPQHTGDVKGITFGPSEKIVLLGNNTLSVWDMLTEQTLQRALPAHNGEITAVALSQGGKILASALADRTVRLWHMDNEKTLQNIVTRHMGDVTTVALNHDGKILASVLSDNTVHLWDVVTGIEKTLPQHIGKVTAVALSHDGKILASVFSDNIVRLWDVRTGKLIQELVHGHSLPIVGVALSYDGKMLASVSLDTIILRDVALSDLPALLLCGLKRTPKQITESWFKYHIADSLAARPSAISPSAEK